MPEPVVINGKKFITSKEAARLTGYARDYVGQLVRMGKVEGKVVEKVLFVNEESLLAHVALKNSNTKVVENSFKTALAAKLASAIAVKKNVSTLIYNQTDGSNFLPKISKVNVKKAEPVVAPKKLVSKYAKVSPAKEVAARVAPYADALGKVGSYAIKHAIGFAILFAVLTTSYASIQTPDLFFSRVSEIISQSSRQNAITSDTDAQVASVFSPFNSFAQKLNHNINEFFGIGGEGTTIVQLPSKVQVATTTVVKEIVRDIGTTTVVQYITARPTITAAPVAGDSVLATEFQNYKIFQQNQLEGIFDSIRRGRSTSSTGGDTINNYNATGTTTLTNLTVENTSTSTIPSLNITSSLTLNGDTITDLVGSGLEISNGVLTATAGSGFSTTSANYHFDNRLAATTTLNNLTTLRGLTDIIATNATVTNLTIGSDYITDITGSGLTVTNGALTVSGASGFSTTSADYWETTQSRWSTSSDSLAFDTRLAATTTLNNLTTLRGLTDIIATNATVTTLAIGSDYITDLTGSGLVVTNGALTVDSSGNWATTSDSYAFDTRLAATTTLNNITTLGSLSLPITQTTGTLSVSRGGTGQTSFGQGWLSSDGTTITSSTSPTVAYITATSTTATSTFPLLSTNALTINGQYFTSLWSTTTDSLAFDTRLAATTTLNNITTLQGLTDLISTRATTTNATSTNFFATLASTTNIFVGNNLSIGTSSQSASINIERPDGLNALFLGRSGAGGSTLGINFAGGIPTLSPTAGALNIASQLTDASIKTMRLTFAHYNAVTSGQICAVVGGTDATSNSIGIGGGSAGCNSATNVALYTASDTTTTTGTVGFVLNNLQNVGIGTQTPTARLNVQGRSGSTTDIFTVASSTGAELFIVKSTGNVGVGTSTPTQAFSVNGNVWITGNATSSTFTATSTTATSTLPLLSTNALSLNGTYVTSLWGTTSDSYAFDTRLAATTTLNNLTKIGTQSTFAFTNATGSSLYLTSLNCTTNNNGGKITTDSSGQLVCANDQTGSGGSGGGTDVNWTFINGSGIAVSTTSNQVVIGASATSTSQKLEVTGGIYLNGSLGIGTTSPAYPLSVNGNAFVTGQVIASYFSATSTNATSTLPSLSTTNLAVGSDYITDLTGTGLSIVNGVLTATNEGTWATTSDSYAFDTRLAATTTLNNITTLLGLTDLISTRATTTNATSTSLYVTTLGIGSDYITDLTGTNLSIVNGALTAADLTFSTTSADYWETTQSRWSTSSDSLAFDTRLAATTTLNNITTLGSLSLPITQTTGTLSVSRGGTGQTSFGQGWLSSDGTTITSSTSPTVAYITATSTTATSTFPLLSTNALTINGQYFTSLWSTTTDSLAFDTRLAATTTLNNITTLQGLTDLISTRATTTNATSTNFFATTASSTNLYTTRLSVATTSQQAAITVQVTGGDNALFLGRTGTANNLAVAFEGGRTNLKSPSGFFNLSNAFSVNQVKQGLITMGNYDDVTYAPRCFGGAQDTGTVGPVFIGGGFVECLAATTVDFFTAENASTTVGSLAMRILGSGNVGIGTTSPYAKLSVVGDIIAKAITATSTFNTSGTTGGYKIDDRLILQSSTTNSSLLIGQNAGLSLLSDGTYNTAVGGESLRTATSSDYLTAVGYRTLYSNTTGSYNTAMGYRSLDQNTTGGSNVGYGPITLYSNTTGNYNVAQGYAALYYNTTGIANTAIGYNAGRGEGVNLNQNSVLDNFATFVGYTASRAESVSSTTQLANITAIGKNARVGASNSLVLGGTGVDSVKVGIGTTTPLAYLDVLSTQGGSTPLFSIASSTSGAATSTAFYVAGNGNVSIGTSTTNTALLTVMGLGTQASPSTIDIVGQNYTISGDALLSLSQSIGSPALRMLVPGTDSRTDGRTANDGYLDAGQGLHLRAGGNGSSGYAFAYNSEIHIGNATDGTIVFRTNVKSATSTERMRLDSFGTLGLGTTSPYAKLSVSSTDTASTTFALRPIASQTANILDIYNTSGALTSVITAAGNVGIGSTAPNAKATIIKDSNGLSNSSPDNYAFTIAPSQISQSSAGISIGTFGSTLYKAIQTFDGPLSLNPAGNNVGIGTTSPYAKLSVAGQTVAEYFTATSTTATSTFPLLSTNALSLNGNYVTSIVGGTGQQNRLAIWSSSNTLTSENSVAWDDLNNTLVLPTLNATNSASILQLASTTILRADNSLGNFFAGQDAGISTASGSYNTGIGQNALQDLTTGAANTALGQGALTAITEGSYNIGFGYNTLSTLLTGSSNVVLGSSALPSFTSGDDNIVIGSSAGNTLTTGSRNILIGSLADITDSISNSVAIGYNSRVTASNSFVLGNNVNVGIGTTSPYAKLSVAGQTVAEYVTATSTTATSTFPLLSTNAIAINGQYFTSLWGTTTDSLAFDTRLAATSTLNNLNILGGLASIGSTTGTTTFLGNSIVNGNFSVGSSTPWGKFVVQNTGTGPSFLVEDSASDTTPFVIDASGNVGIGTSTPSVKFEIGGSATGNRVLFDTSASSNRTLSFERNSVSNAWSIQSSLTNTGTAASLMLNPNGGSIGIGTTTTSLPAVLSVSGGAYLTGNVYVEGDIEARGKITATSTRTQYMGNTGVRTYYAYGDSITQGSSPTTAANHYTAIISRTFGYTLDNQGVNGSVLEEDGQIDAIYAQPVSTSTVATLLTGYNNHRYYGTTASRLDTFKQALPAALAYLAIPDGQKVFAPNFSTTGSWSATTTYATTSGRFTRSAGATASTVLYGNTIYVVGTRGASTDTGTFTLTVDGVDKGTYSCAGVGSSFTDSRVYAPFMMRVGNLSNGQHNVTVTSNNTGYCEINWAAGNGSNGIDGIPAVYVGGALRMTDAAYVSNGVNGSLESNKLYNQVVENVTKTLASDGLNVIQVEAEQVYDPATMDSGDLVHPGDRGHYALAQAFIKKMTGTSFGAEKNFARFFNGYLPKFTIGAGTSTIFTFDGETGRFGVGTSSPIQALSINGNAWITGNATSSTFTATSTTASSTLPLLQSTRISVATSLSIGTTSQSEELVVGDTAVIGNELSILELGSQTDAGIYFGNDTNTGLFAPALDNFAITTGGTERLRIDSVGDIGIGSTSPFARLSVDTNGLTTSIPSFSIGSSTKTDFMIQGLSGNISIGTTTSNRGKIEISHPSPSPVINIDGSASGADVFRFYRSNANGGTGNYGMALKIQTSNPSFVFRSGVSSSLEGTILNAVSHISSTDAMVFSTSTAVTLTNTGIEPMYLKNASSNIGIAGTSTPWGSLSVNGIYQESGEPTFVIGSSTKTDFVVHQSGFVGVGTTSPWRTFSTNGSVAMNGLTTAAGTPSSICMNTTTKEVTVNAATSCVVSDRDQKQNIQDLSVSGLDAIRAIKTVTFSYNDIPGRSRIGFIAQDLQAVDNRLGDAFDKNGIARSIDIPAIMSVTVKAVQELDTKVDTNNVFVQSLASSTQKALQEQKNKPLSLTFENGFKFEINQATSTEKYLQINSSSGAEVITFDEAGNIGIGDTTPDYKLQVAGDIAATAFVNVSTRESKKDITYLDDEEKMDVLKKLSTIKIAQYRYKLEDPENPLRLGLIAEEAPAEVLSASGKGVDIYKLSTFTLGAVQAQQKKISELEIRLSALEAQVASSTPAIPSDMLASFMDGMKNIFTDSLTVGSATKPSGITLFDEKTGEPYCIKVVNGEMKSTAGKCTVVKIEEPTEIVDKPTETEEVSTTTATTTPSAPEVKEEPKPTASSTPSTPSSPSTPSIPDPKPVEEAPKAEEPKVEEPKVEAPAPVVEAPKVEAPKEEVKSEEPKAEEPKAEAPKVEEKKEEPKQEESKPAESAPSSSESSSVDTN